MPLAEKIKELGLEGTQRYMYFCLVHLFVLLHILMWQFS